jgi:hypothetical protein
MVEETVSQQREHARVPRDHLSQLIHPGSRSAEEELVQHLRSKRCIRRSMHARAGGKSHGQIVDAISIRERPAEAEDRAIPGHWEGDLLAGTGNSHIATLWNDSRALSSWSKCRLDHERPGASCQRPEELSVFVNRGECVALMKVLSRRTDSPCSHRLRTNPKESSGALILNGLDLKTPCEALFT